MFNLAHGYARRQMSAFVELQEAEFAAADRGFTAVKHQREVGTGYFDAVTQAIQRRAVVDHRAQGLDRGRAVSPARHRGVTAGKNAIGRWKRSPDCDRDNGNTALFFA